MSGVVPALDQPSLGAVEGMLESEGRTTAITGNGTANDLAHDHIVWPVGP